MSRVRYDSDVLEGKTVKYLRNELEKYDLPKSGNKVVLIDRLLTFNKTVVQLKQELKERSLKTQGKKIDLVRRLVKNPKSSVDEKNALLSEGKTFEDLVIKLEKIIDTLKIIQSTSPQPETQNTLISLRKNLEKLQEAIRETPSKELLEVAEDVSDELVEVTSEGTSIQGLEKLRYLPDALYAVLDNLSDKDLGNLFQASEKLAQFSNDDQVFQDCFRLAYGEQSYEEAKTSYALLRSQDGRKCEIFWKDLYLDAQKLDTGDIYSICDPENFLALNAQETSSKGFENLLCNLTYFRRKYLRSRFGSPEDMVDGMDSVHLREYFALDPESAQDPDLYRHLGYTSNADLDIVELLFQNETPFPNGYEHYFVEKLILQSQRGLDLLLKYKIISKNYFNRKKLVPRRLYEAMTGNILHIVASRDEDDPNYIRDLFIDPAYLSLVNERNNDGKTPLMVAIDNKNYEMAKMMIAKASNIDYLLENNQGETALEEFVKTSKPDDVLLRLLARTSPVSGKLIENVGSLQTLRTLLVEMPFESSRYDLSKNLRYTEAILADEYDAYSDEAEIATLLKEQGAVFANVGQRDEEGSTLLHRLLLRKPQGYVAMVQDILEQGDNPNAMDNDGNVPLFFADGNLEIIELLRSYGADFDYVNKENGLTVLMENLGGRSLTLESLRKITENMSDEVIEALDRFGDNALNYIRFNEDFLTYLRFLTQEYNLQPQGSFLKTTYGMGYIIDVEEMLNILSDLRPPYELSQRQKHKLLYDNLELLGSGTTIKNVVSILESGVDPVNYNKEDQEPIILYILQSKISAEDTLFLLQTFIDYDLLDANLTFAGDEGDVFYYIDDSEDPPPDERSLLSLVAKHYETSPDQSKMLSALIDYGADPYLLNSEGQVYLRPEILNNDIKEELYPKLFDSEIS